MQFAFLKRDFESCQEFRGPVLGSKVWGPVQGSGSGIRGLVLKCGVPFFRYAYKALIWVPKLHGPKIDNAMSKLLENST